MITCIVKVCVVEVNGKYRPAEISKQIKNVFGLLELPVTDRSVHPSEISRSSGDPMEKMCLSQLFKTHQVKVLPGAVIDIVVRYGISVIWCK